MWVRVMVRVWVWVWVSVHVRARVKVMMRVRIWVRVRRSPASSRLSRGQRGDQSTPESNAASGRGIIRLQRRRAACHAGAGPRRPAWPRLQQQSRVIARAAFTVCSGPRPPAPRRPRLNASAKPASPLEGEARRRRASGAARGPRSDAEAVRGLAGPRRLNDLLRGRPGARAGAHAGREHQDLHHRD